MITADILVTNGCQRFKYNAKTHDTRTIEEEQIDERGNGDSLVAKYMQVSVYRVKQAKPAAKPAAEPTAGS